MHLEDHESNSPSDFYCRGWLTVYQKEKVISKLYFPSIESVGGCYGFFIPENQPRMDFFIISKFADYQASIFIINDLGEVTELNGGSFYISSDNRFLFSNDGSDLPGLTVYDLNKESLIYSDSTYHYLHYWFFEGGKYFATIWNESTDQIDTNQIAFFNTQNKKLKISPYPINTISDDIKLKIYNSQKFLNLNRCNCGR